MKYSYTKLKTYELCEYKYFLKYIEKIRTCGNDSRYGGAMRNEVGSHIHSLIYKTPAQQEQYLANLNLDTAIKVKDSLQKLLYFKYDFEKQHNLQLVEKEKVYYYNDIKVKLDTLYKNDKDEYFIVDFKCISKSTGIDWDKTNNQMNLYKYVLEKNNFKIKKMYIIGVETTTTIHKQNEEYRDYIQRIIELNKDNQISLYEVQIIDNFENKIDELIKKIEQSEYLNEFKKEKCSHCNKCEFNKLCNRVNTSHLFIFNDEKTDTQIYLTNTKEQKVGLNFYIDIYETMRRLQDKYNVSLSNRDHETVYDIKFQTEFNVYNKIKKLIFSGYYDNIFFYIPENYEDFLFMRNFLTWYKKLEKFVNK